MTPHRIFVRTGLLCLFAAMLSLGTSAKADSPTCCADVMFPEHHGWGEGRAIAIVDQNADEGRGVYNSIGKAVAAVRPGGEVMVKPGNYVEKLITIRQSVKISNAGGGVVRASFDGPCIDVNIRRGGGRVVITGISFETTEASGACIDVERASEFALMASDITAIDKVGRDDFAPSCNPSGSESHPKMRCGLVGVLVESGVAMVQGSRIRRTGTAIALIGAGQEAHKIQGNYIAGNGTGIYASGGTKFDIEHNGIFRNHEYGVSVEDALGVIADNDIEDNYTGLKLRPPSAFSGTAYAGGGTTASDYSDMSRPSIRVERNLITQYGVYRPDSRNLMQAGLPYSRKAGPESDYYASSNGAGTTEPGDKDSYRYGYAFDFDLDQQYLQDNVYDYPKRGSILSGLDITQNCIFGPTISWFDRDRFTRVIAGNKVWPMVGDEKGGHVGKDALTPLFAPLFDVNTWVEHLDYDAVDKIDHENSIRSPKYDGFSGGLWTSIHNWFARNKKEMVCTFRFQEPVVSAPGNWPRFDTNPVR